MEPELISMAITGGPYAIITGMILWFLRPLREDLRAWIKKKTGGNDA